jgi:hypothetical protein
MIAAMQSKHTQWKRSRASGSPTPTPFGNPRRQGSAADTKETAKPGRAAALLKWLGFVSAVMALVGWLYHEGLINGMGLPSAFFPAKAEELPFLAYSYLITISSSAFSIIGKNLFHLALYIACLAFVIGVSVWLLVTVEDLKVGQRIKAAMAKQARDRRHAFALVVGTASGVATSLSMLAVLLAVASFILAPLHAYQVGREEGMRVLSQTSCTAKNKELSRRCVEVTFDNGERVTGVLLAGTPGNLALRVAGKPVIYSRPVATMTAGTFQQDGK